jgi:hypothetical protein
MNEVTFYAVSSAISATVGLQSGNSSESNRQWDAEGTKGAREIVGD